MTKPTTVIETANVSKDFILPHQDFRTLKSMFTNMFRSKNKSYEIQHALKDIDLSIEEGEFFGIVGRNGSGKSTLLKILAGIYQPTTGRVRTNGRLVPFIELGVGFNGDLTGRENVALNGALLGYSEKEVQEKYDTIVEFAELDRFMDQKLKNYSSGMQVRLAFSVATQLAESDILLIDEVLAVGDAGFQRKCFRYFKELKRANKTVVFVTHDMSAVREYCDRAVLIERQEIVAEGTPEQIARKYEKLLQPTATADQESAKESNSKQWGDKALKIQKPKSTVSENELLLSYKVKALRDCDDPMFGVAVVDGSGQPLFGTNTRIQKSKVGAMKKGQELTVEWKIPNVLADGEYTFTVAAQYDSGNTTAHWWDRAAKFVVTKDIHTPYAIQPDIEVNLGAKK